VCRPAWCCPRARTPHRDRHRQEGPARLDSADDETALARGIYDVYQQTNLRYSQMARSRPSRRRTPDESPGSARALRNRGDEYRFLFVTKGGGSANKSFLYQETAAILDRARLLAFLEQKAKTLGTAPAALSPRHRHRRHIRRGDDEGGEARVVPRPR